VNQLFDKSSIGKFLSNVLEEKIADESEENKLKKMKNKRLAYQKMIERSKSRLFPEKLDSEDIRTVIYGLYDELGIENES
jgi:hypothetical protein